MAGSTMPWWNVRCMAGQFDVCTGKALCEPAEHALQTYPIRVVDGRIEVLLPS